MIYITYGDIPENKTEKDQQAVIRPQTAESRKEPAYERTFVGGVLYWHRKQAIK